MEDDSSDWDGTDLSTFPPEYTEPDRKRGILTKNDREYLLDELEISGQDERNIRYRIRQRLIQSFLDLQLLSKEYPDDELEKVMDHDDIPERGTILSLVNMAYNISVLESRFTTEDFERIIEQVVRQQRVKQIEVPQSLEDFHEIEANVDISVKEGDIQSVIDSLVKSEVDTEVWAAFARRADVFSRMGVFESDNIEMVPIQPPGAEEATMVIEPIAEMIKRSEERFEKE